MSFSCPDCSNSGSLKIANRLELRPDSDWDELTLQLVTCCHCDFHGAAVYKESRRGALDSEIWDHTGYRLSRSEWQRLRTIINRCRTPGLASCTCESHRQLGSTNPQTGRWVGIANLDQAATFPMHRTGQP